MRACVCVYPVRKVCGVIIPGFRMAETSHQHFFPFLSLFPFQNRSFIGISLTLHELCIKYTNNNETGEMDTLEYASAHKIHTKQLLIIIYLTQSSQK